MRVLLISAGFRISGKRADCIHCHGGAHLTVSFNDEVAYCHRCKWTANKATLARKLGKAATPETAAHRAARAKAVAIVQDADAAYKLVAAEYRRLGRMGAIAKDVLAMHECEPAWDALARFYRSERKLVYRMDLLSFRKPE
jgi:hypothetical protein